MWPWKATSPLLQVMGGRGTKEPIIYDCLGDFSYITIDDRWEIKFIDVDSIMRICFGDLYDITMGDKSNS